MAYTISTQFGNEVQEQHNFDKKFRNKETSVVNKTGGFEIWEYTPIREKYHGLFDAAVEEYNKKIDKKKHPERIIKDYYEKIQKDKQKYNAYELIAAVGNIDHHPDDKLCKKILHDFIYGNEELDVLPWSVRNPNLVTAGCAFHADERGVVHIHLDYIPVAYKIKRGMKVQTSYRSALIEQGTDISSFRRTENELLQYICEQYGLEIEHPQAGKNSVHKSTAQYKAEKKVEGLEKRADRIYEYVEDMKKKAEAEETMLKKRERRAAAKERSAKAKEKYWDRQKQEIQKSKQQLEDGQKALRQQISALEQWQEQLINEKEMDLDEACNAWDNIQDVYKDAVAQIRQGVGDLSKGDFTRLLLEQLRSFVKNWKFRDGRNAWDHLLGEKITDIVHRVVKENWYKTPMGFVEETEKKAGQKQSELSHTVNRIRKKRPLPDLPDYPGQTGQETGLPFDF